MELKLKRPVCFFDLETTGIDIARDRIVEISIFKVMPGGNKEAKTWRVNPGMHIPKHSSDIHGITDDMVKDCPGFKELAPAVHQMIKDSDFGGYNSNKFDIPLLAEEMLRAGLDFDMKNRVSVDVQNIFHKKEQRTLSAAYRFYCDKELIGAHGAEADTMATYEILLAQLDRYEDMQNDMDFLSQYSSRGKTADFAGFIALDKDGCEMFTFGKHKGKKVEEVFAAEPSYCAWILDADFPLYTKKVVMGIKLRALNTKQH